jgi:ligand-binding sensor protein
MASFGFDNEALTNALKKYVSLSKEISKSRNGPADVYVSKYNMEDHTYNRYTLVKINEFVIGDFKVIDLELNPDTGKIIIKRASDAWKADADFLAEIASKYIIEVKKIPASTKTPASNMFSKVKGIFRRGGKASTRRRRQTKRR